MPSHDSAFFAIEAFAAACERLNAFAQTLTEAEVYETVRAGADIRGHESGWRLEKWVEAGLDAEGEVWAVWWLELGAQGNQWLIESHLSIGPEGIFIALPDRSAKTAAELAPQLDLAVAELIDAQARQAEFGAEIARRLTGKVAV